MPLPPGTPPSLVSEAPLRSELVPLDDGGIGLRRTLHPVFARIPRAVACFEGEVEAAIRSSRPAPGLARVLETRGPSGLVLVREYRPEGTLADLLDAEVPFRAEQALEVVCALAEALDALEQTGTVHGDPFPGNVLLRLEGGVCLADPSSARRAFALGLKREQADVQRASDRARLLPLLGQLLRQVPLDGEGASPDPLRREVASLFGQRWDGERKLAALQRLRPREAPPMPGVPPPRPAAAAAPIPVLVAVGPLPDERLRHAAARQLAPLLGELPHRLGTRLAQERVLVESRFPEPSRSIAHDLAEAGVPASIRPRQSSGSRTSLEKEGPA